MHWSYLLPLCIFLVSTGLALFSRAAHWTVNTSLEQADEPHPPQNENLRTLLTRHRWEFILAAIITAILLFVVLFAPPRLTGEIPPDPNQPGRPFFSLHWGRDFLRNNFNTIANWSNIFIGFTCLASITIAIKNRSRLHAEISLLFSSLALAISAQWNLADKLMTPIDTGFYIASALGVGLWAWLARPRLLLDLKPTSSGPIWELPLLLLILALTTYARFYALNSVPYGIEGDESKWTSEVVRLVVLGETDPSAEYHRDALPVSFYSQAPFHRFFGAGLISARMTVAFLSVLASAVFYWLMRQVSPIPLAMLATYLLSASIFDISASRLANVESFVKLWAILPLALLAWILKKKNWRAFSIIGVALALAALTYDTLWPIGIVCIGLTLIELRGVAIQERAKSLAALAAPPLLTLPVLIPYFISRVSYYELDKKGWQTEFLEKFWEHFSNVAHSWFVGAYPDFLYNRDGPLLNAALLPWLLTGMIASILLVRARSAYWLLAWAGIIILPVPILANSPLGRIYFPALAAVYGLIATGIFLAWREFQRITVPVLRPILTAAALVPLFWLPLFNLYIYFNEVYEPEGGQIRREIGEIAATVTDSSILLVLAVVPKADEPLNSESQMVELFMLKNLTGEQIKNAYQHIALEDVIPAISNQFANWKKIIIVLDKFTANAKEERIALTEGLVACFPRGKLIEGRHFDQFVIDEISRAEADCTPAELSLRVENPTRFRWELSAGKATSVLLICERQISNYIWLEAETIPLSPGWQMEINHATGWFGDGFLLDEYGSQPLAYETDLKFSGAEIHVWARTFKRAIDDSPAYMTINESNIEFANTAEESLNQWIWERLGTFPNNDPIRITITRPYKDDLRDFMSLFLDAFFFTDNPALMPDMNLVEQMPVQRYPVIPISSTGIFTPNLEAGQYICRAQIASSLRLVDTLGRPTITSNEVQVTVP